MGKGQHAGSLWRRHVQTMARVGHMPSPGHGYGPADSQGFNVQQFESSGFGEITKFKNKSTETMHPMSAVFINSSSADEDTAAENAAGTPLRTYDGYENLTSVGTKSEAILGTVLATVNADGIGYAITGGYAWTWVSVGDDDGSGNYVDTGANGEIRTNNDDDAKISATFPRRHCGRGFIVRMIGNSTVNDCQLALVYWQAGPSLNRHCPINITDADGDGTTAFTYTAWTEQTTDGYSGATSGDCGDATNILEASKGWHDSGWLDGWKMREISGTVHARLEYKPDTDDYDVTFSVSPQFYGDCD